MGMNRLRFSPGLLVLLLLLAPLRSPAQNFKLLLTFHGTCLSNNAAGQFVSRAVSQRNWMRDFANTVGLTNLSAMTVVYHVNADERGDIIEVVDAKTGLVLDTPFLLFFGQDASLGRVALTNSVGNQVRIIQYVYTHQNKYSMGAALLNQRLKLNASGTVTNAIITGTMYYVMETDSLHNRSFFTGTLTTGKRLDFRNAP